MEQAKVVVKQSGEKFDKKKSQFNYESIIEITLPSAPAQSTAIFDISHDKTFVEEKLEEPITPIICTPKIPQQHNNMSPTSVHESFVSNKQNPMEWDSFIPVSSSPSVAINSFPPTEVHFIYQFPLFLRVTSHQHSKTSNYAIRWSSAIAN